MQVDLLPFLPGRPLKTYVGTVKQLVTPLILRGWRCGDGFPMRFFFGNELHIDGVQPQDTPDSRRFSVASLERAGHPSAYFKPYPGNKHVNYGGYFIFPTAGKYLLRLYARNSEIASVVIDTSEGGPYPGP